MSTKPVWIVLGFVVAFLFGFGVVQSWGPSEAEKVRTYYDCQDRQIAAGSTFQTAVAVCEHKR